MEDTKYKFIGVIDSYNIYPDFVRPVFEKDGKYYFQSGKKGIITEFKEIKKEIHDRILNLSNINFDTNIKLKEIYTIGDEPIICFRINKEDYFISDLNNAVTFVRNINIDDDILKEEIDTFFECVKIKNRKERKLIKQNN